jgi:copper(I)-binding protein
MERTSVSRPRGGPASRVIAALSVLAALISLAGPALAADASLTVSDGIIRTIIPSRPAAGYFTLTNDGENERVLTGAASPGCGMVMLHKSETVDGIDKMMPVDSIPVPAHGGVTFAPGGLHLMCMSPAASLKPGTTVPVTLEFGDGGTLTSDFAVRGVADK